MSVPDMVVDLVHSSIEIEGYELVDVEYLKEGGSWYLRIYIDKEGGVTLDDCEMVSKIVDRILEDKDIISQSYNLEVSSPGIERPLKKDNDFIRFMGNEVVIKTFEPVNNRKKIKGILLGLEEGNIVVKDDEQKYYIPKDKVASARLSVELF